MWVRSIKGQVMAGQVDEFARRWQEVLPELLRAAPGFQHAYLAADRASGVIDGISLWDTPPDQAVLDRVFAEFLPRVQDLVRDRPTVEEYEVLTEV